MEALISAVSAQVKAEGSKPIQLAEIYLNSGTLRYAATNVNVVFPTGGDTYSAKAFGVSNKKVSRNGQIVEMDFQFDNITGDMHGFNVAERFDGKAFILKKVYSDELGTSTYYRERINGYMEEPKFDKRWMYLKVIDGKVLGRRTINEYYQKPCNNIFGGAKCNKDGLATLTSTPSLTATGIADSGATNYLIDNALSQADDFWNFGRIEVGISGVTYYRKTVDFIATTHKVIFDVPFFSSVSSCKYAIYKGCPLTWDACESGSTEAYGPSGNNSVNFIGFIHLANKE